MDSAQCEATICSFASSLGDCHFDAWTAAGNLLDGFSTDVAIHARHLPFGVRRDLRSRVEPLECGSMGQGCGSVSNISVCAHNRCVWSRQRLADVWSVSAVARWNFTVVYDGRAFTQHLFDIKNVAFTRILMDQGIYVAMLIFAAGLHQLIRRARSESEWIATLLFGAALGWVAVTVVADGLEGGAILDTLNGNSDPSAVRALVGC